MKSELESDPTAAVTSPQQPVIGLNDHETINKFI